MKKWHQLLTDPNAPVTYLDKKWFYTTNRRRRIKKLPHHPDEEEFDLPPPPKVLSRRFPIKAMFMGVVGRPIPARQFDGRVHMERVSEMKVVQKLTAHKKF